MTQDKVEIVRRGFETLQREGFEAFLSFFHPEFETETPPDLSVEPDRYVGPEGIRRWFESFYEAVDEIRFEPDEFIPVGDKVVVPIRLIVKGRDTGIRAEQRMTQVWTLRGDQAIRLEVFAETEPALEAARVQAEQAS